MPYSLIYPPICTFAGKTHEEVLECIEANIKHSHQMGIAANIGPVKTYVVGSEQDIDWCIHPLRREPGHVIDPQPQYTSMPNGRAWEECRYFAWLTFTTLKETDWPQLEWAKWVACPTHLAALISAIDPEEC